MTIVGSALKRIFYYITRFGIFEGSRIYLQKKLIKKGSFTIPGVKHPIFLRTRTSDINIFENVFVRGEYEIEYGMVPEYVIDCGANIGMFAVWIKSRYPNAKLICIEPDPENFEILKKNVSHYKDVICVNCGIWSKNTLLKVYDKYNKGKWGMVVEEDLENGSVQALSIASLVEQHNLPRIDLLKIDIETSEKELFSTNYEGWLNNVEVLLIELHDWMEEGCSKPFFEAINKSMLDYAFSTKGENVIIYNKKFSSESHAMRHGTTAC